MQVSRSVNEQGKSFARACADSSCPRDLPGCCNLLDRDTGEADSVCSVVRFGETLRMRESWGSLRISQCTGLVETRLTEVTMVLGNEDGN